MAGYPSLVAEDTVVGTAGVGNEHGDHTVFWHIFRDCFFSAQSSPMSSRAALAAFCSASFLLFPVPRVRGFEFR